jgi:adenylosuccinate synthase
MPASIVAGLQWGDEGKGKIVDSLAATADIVARFSGGANAGHTVNAGGERFALHQVPTGLVREGVTGVIGSGCVIDPVSLAEEVRTLEQSGLGIEGRFMISGKVHLVHPAYRIIERAEEAVRGAGAIGTTGKGIGPAYVEKYRRRGIRLEDAASEETLDEKISRQTSWCLSASGTGPDGWESLADEVDRFRSDTLWLAEYAADVSMVLNRSLDDGLTLIAEGAQGTLLDPDHGTYPFVTCGSCVASSACTSLGIGPTRIDEVVGVMKAYCTRVGSGPFPTEQDNEIGEQIRIRGNEFGTTTGRPRRCGWFDGVLAGYAARLNGCTWISLTLLDVLSGMGDLSVCTGYDLDPDASLTIFETGSRLGRHVPRYDVLPGWEEDIAGERSWDSLPVNARRYVELLEKLSGVPIRAVSTGPDRDDIIWR